MWIGDDERIERRHGSGGSGARGGVDSVVDVVVGGGVLGLSSAHLRPFLPGRRRKVLARAVSALRRVHDAARRLQIVLCPPVQNLLPTGLHQVFISLFYRLIFSHQPPFCDEFTVLGPPSGPVRARTGLRNRFHWHFNSSLFQPNFVETFSSMFSTKFIFANWIYWKIQRLFNLFVLVSHRVALAKIGSWAELESLWKKYYDKKKKFIVLILLKNMLKNFTFKDEIDFYQMRKSGQFFALTLENIGLQDVWREDRYEIWFNRHQFSSKYLQTSVQQSSFFKKLVYWNVDRLFGTKQCAKCDLTLQSDELVMRGRDHFYHTRCFSCHVCNIHLTKGSLNQSQIIVFKK